MSQRIWPCAPGAQEVDAWCESLELRACQEPVEAVVMKEGVLDLGPSPRHFRPQYVRIRRGPRTFYGIWQPARTPGPAPLLVHLPGYGAEMAVHPELVARGFHVLHVNPCGYNTPSGFDESLRDDQGGWPVLAETARSGGQAGYVDWLADALCAVAWARSRPEVASERLGLLGTSQGGGTALLLGSILRDSCRSLCADVPFLTGFRLALEELEDPGVYGMVYGPLMQGPQAQLEQARRAVSFVDTLCHAHRLTMPVLLTAGLVDKACPPETIEALFAALPGTASLTRIAGQGHASTVEFLALASAWFTLHV